MRAMMKGRKHRWIILFVFAFSTFLLSQATGKGKMKGVVTDEQGKPIPEVKIKMFCHNAQANSEIVADKDGSWKAFWIRGGNWDLDFLKVGYEPRRISISIDESGKIFEVPIKLKKVEGVLLTPELMNQLDQGNNLFTQGKFDEALAVFQDILKNNPEAYIVHLNIGNCYFEKKDYDQAIANYQKVLDNDPKHVKVMISIGNSYSNKGDQAKALEWYQKIEFEKIDDAVILYNIGVFFFNNNDFTNAIKYLKRSVEVKEDFLDGLFQLGIAYTAANNYPDAAATFEKYLKFDPNSERAEQIKLILKSLKK